MYRQYFLLSDDELKSYLKYLNNEKGLSINKIASKLGCSKATASRWFRKFKIPLIKNYDVYVPYKRYGYETIDDLYNDLSSWRTAGISKTNIADRLGCTRQTAIRLLRRFHLE